MTRYRLGLMALALAAMALTANQGAFGQSQSETQGQTPGQAPSQTPGQTPEPAAWHTVTGPERSFTADLPAAPKYTATEMKTVTGTRYTMHQYLLEQADYAYVVQSAIYPTEVNVSNPRTNLQGGLDNAAKNMEGGKWTSVDWTTHQGLTAVNATGIRQGHAIRSFSVLKERQIFTLTYAGPSGTAQSPDVERFVSSLRVGN